MSFTHGLAIGEIVKDFGEVHTQKALGVRRSISVVAARRKGDQQLYLRFSSRGLLAMSPIYHRVSLDALTRLGEIGREAEGLTEAPEPGITS